ncbi:YqhA family protein [Methanogenium marinum]|uniref:YqhA family protein n=1 Tax=Methanogenium marinum TaxID=348610 RepID=A0A9Q4PY56_9EURY|nr:YqhA family protein [Methanogenium marinum]MDE4908038.1 YqhA family protein [Methanogenium marinum]
MVWKYFTKTRYLVIIAAISSFFGSALMFFIGVEKTISAFVYFFYGRSLSGGDILPEYLTPGDLATVSLAQSIDVFLFALVMMIFAYGILYLFLVEDEEKERLSFPGWLRIKNIFQLKMILGEVIVFILFVHFLETATKTGYANLTLESLILPASILLLSVSLMVLRQGE